MAHISICFINTAFRRITSLEPISILRCTLRGRQPVRSLLSLPFTASSISRHPLSFLGMVGGHTFLPRRSRDVHGCAPPLATHKHASAISIGVRVPILISVRHTHWQSKYSSYCRLSPLVLAITTSHERQSTFVVRRFIGTCPLPSCSSWPCTDDLRDLISHDASHLLDPHITAR